MSLSKILRSCRFCNHPIFKVTKMSLNKNLNGWFSASLFINSAFKIGLKLSNCDVSVLKKFSFRRPHVNMKTAFSKNSALECFQKVVSSCGRGLKMSVVVKARGGSFACVFLLLNSSVLCLLCHINITKNGVSFLQGYFCICIYIINRSSL